MPEINAIAKPENTFKNAEEKAGKGSRIKNERTKNLFNMMNILYFYFYFDFDFDF
jgi:3-methyladenine DNA glycosylase Mpg